MKYFKMDDSEYTGIEGITYAEVEGGGHFRYITVTKDEYLASNVKHPQFGFNMPDTGLDQDYEEFDDVIPISQEEFEQVWQAHLERHKESWENAKNAHPIGLQVNGYIERFFPQGAIINLGDNALGVADYKSCEDSTRPGYLLGSGDKVTAIVAGYDEVNQWIVLQSPQVHEDPRRLSPAKKV